LSNHIGERPRASYNEFQVHAIDAAEKIIVRKQLRRSQVLEFFKALPPIIGRGRLSLWLRQRPNKKSGNGRMKLRLCIHELQG
jgi:hypothetical protein